MVQTLAPQIGNELLTLLQKNLGEKHIILALAIFLLIPTSAFASADEPSPNEPIIYEGTNNPVIFGAGEWDTILISDYGLSSSAPTTTRTVLFFLEEEIYRFV